MRPFEWLGAATLAQAASAQPTTVAGAMLSVDGTPPGDAVVLKAAGTDLLGLVKDGLLRPRRVVGLDAVPGLRDIRATPQGGLRIGALCSLAQIAQHPLVRTRYRALADAAARSASPQIRTVATIGGNLLQRPRCWYFRSPHHHCARKGGSACFAFAGENDYHAIFDHAGCAMVHPSTPATALVALEARIEIAAPRATARTLALESFFVLPTRSLTRENDLRAGEIVTALLLPPATATMRSVHLRQGQLESFDWPLADVAVVLDADDGVCRRAAVVLGAAAPAPHRAIAAQQALVGQRLDETTAQRAAQAAVADAQPLSGNAYKVPLFEALVRRAIRALREAP